MSDGGMCSPSTSLFTGSSLQSFKRTNFHTAGQDMFMQVVNVNLPKSNGEVAPTPSSPKKGTLTGPGPSESSPAQKRSLLARLSLLLQFKNHGRTDRDSLLIEQADAGPGFALVDDVTGRNIPSQSSSASSLTLFKSDGLSVSSAEDVSTVPLSAEPTKPETYIQEMHRSGQGLAVWNPRPDNPNGDEQGVVPGDVGIFSAREGFKKIFNIVEDKQAIRASNFSQNEFVPPALDAPCKEALPMGHTFAQGTSTDIEFTPDGRALASGAFRCLSSKGAILALTSPADIHELKDRIELRDFIINNASLLYQYANSIRRLDNDESLYFITGCLKSDSWALAAFNEPVDPPNDVLRLIQTGGSSETSAPNYAWTSRATAEAWTGSNPTRGKDTYTGRNQSLFLRGYKMTFSPEFRLRMNGHSPGPGGPDRGDGSPKSDSSNGGEDRFDGPHARKGPPKDASHGGSGSQSSNGSTSSYGNVCSHDLPIVQNFPMYREAPHLHPCDSINEQLLEETRADCALSHDDDWRFVFQNNAPDHASFNALESNSFFVRNGVAFLTSTPNYDSNPDAASITSPDLVEKSVSIPSSPSISSFDTVDKTIPALKLEDQKHRDSKFFDRCSNLSSLGSSFARMVKSDADAQVAAEAMTIPLRGGDELHLIESGDAHRPTQEILNFQLSAPPIQYPPRIQSKEQPAVTQDSPFHGNIRSQVDRTPAQTTARFEREKLDNGESLGDVELLNVHGVQEEDPMSISNQSIPGLIAPIQRLKALNAAEKLPEGGDLIRYDEKRSGESSNRASKRSRAKDGQPIWKTSNEALFEFLKKRDDAQREYIASLESEPQRLGCRQEHGGNADDAYLHLRLENMKITWDDVDPTEYVSQESEPMDAEGHSIHGLINAPIQRLTPSLLEGRGLIDCGSTSVFRSRPVNIQNVPSLFPVINPDLDRARYLPKAVPLDRRDHDRAPDPFVPPPFLRGTDQAFKSTPKGQTPPKGPNYRFDSAIPGDQCFDHAYPNDFTMGSTGAGKSSCTTITLPPTHPVKPNCRVVLVDTPGFNDTEQAEYGLLKRISGWLGSFSANEQRQSVISKGRSIGSESERQKYRTIPPLRRRSTYRKERPRQGSIPSISTSPRSKGVNSSKHQTSVKLGSPTISALPVPEPELEPDTMEGSFSQALMVLSRPWSPSPFGITPIQLTGGTGDTGSTGDDISYGTIKEQGESKPVVLKTYRRINETTVEKVTQRTYREVKLLAALHGPPGSSPNINLFQLPEALPGIPSIVVDFVKDLSLEYLAGKGFGARLNIVQQLGRGLLYMHSLGLVHGDVKPDNFRVTEDGIVKIIDLGLGRYDTDEHTGLTTMILPCYRFIAPELIIPGMDDVSMHVTKATDVYAFSMTALQVLDGREFRKSRPFNQCGVPFAVRFAIESQEWPQAQHYSGVTAEAWRAISACWTPTAAGRPRVDELLKELSEVPVSL